MRFCAAALLQASAPSAAWPLPVPWQPANPARTVIGTVTGVEVGVAVSVAADGITGAILSVIECPAVCLLASSLSDFAYWYHDVTACM